MIRHAPPVCSPGPRRKGAGMRDSRGSLCRARISALARSLYYTTRRVAHVIREECFPAVAGVLAFVFSLKRGELRCVRMSTAVALRFDAEAD